MAGRPEGKHDIKIEKRNSKQKTFQIWKLNLKKTFFDYLTILTFRSNLWDYLENICRTFSPYLFRNVYKNGREETFCGGK